MRCGRCAYCGAAGSERSPLTREHAIPRSRGGRRRDPGVIVPACVACNRRRGAQPLPLFLLAAPARIARLIDHFLDLPVDALRAVDPRVFADLLAVVWLREPAADRPGRPLSPRAVQRRRRSARRALEALAVSLPRERGRARARPEPPRLQRARPDGSLPPPHDIIRGLAVLLAPIWDVPPGRVHERLVEELDRRTPTPIGKPRIASGFDDAVASLTVGPRPHARPRRRAA